MTAAAMMHTVQLKSGVIRVASVALAAAMAPAVAASARAALAALIKSGRIRLIATTGPQRAPACPNVPTTAEAGIADFLLTLWTGLLAPAGTPTPVMARLQDALAKTLREPEVRWRLQAMAVTPDSGNAETFAKTIAAETALWAGVAKAVNIKAE